MIKVVALKNKLYKDYLTNIFSPTNKLRCYAYIIVGN